MRRRGRSLLFLVIGAVLLATTAWGEVLDDPAAMLDKPPEEAPAEPKRIGRIMVHEREGWFEVPATVLRDEPPLEFIVATSKGHKAYESLLEIEANAVDFNLACIVLGLDAARAKPPRFHFDPLPVDGDSVGVWISWEKDGERTKVDVAELIQLDGKAAPGSRWVYTGSGFGPDGRYLADLDGTAVGFVHDPASIIEHREGFGLERFGDVVPNANVAPPVGTKVTFIVERLKPPPRDSAVDTPPSPSD